MKVLEQEVASIAKAMHDIKPIETIFETVEEGFPKLSFYFPPVEMESGRDTLSSVRYDYSMYVKVFAKNSKEASAIADEVVRKITLNKNLIEEVGVDGIKTGRVFRLIDPSYREVDTGAIQIYIRWSSVYYFDNYSQKTVNFIFDNSLKEE